MSENIMEEIVEMGKTAVAVGEHFPPLIHLNFIQLREHAWKSLHL